MQEKQLAWVFGASGLTGRWVVRSLGEAQIQCNAHLRPDSSCASQARSFFQRFGAEVQLFSWSEEELRSRLAQAPPTVVFLLLGTTRRRTRSDGQGYRAIDFALTKMVLKVIEAEHPQCQIVYLSAVRPPGVQVSDYFRIRCELEVIIDQMEHKSIVVQPSLIVGEREDSRPLETMAAAFTDRGLSLLSAFGINQASRYRSMSGESLGKAMVQLWLEQTSFGVVQVDELTEADLRFRESIRAE